ncbi:MAG: glycoside hydrolase [Planctomycetota bacterium]
MNRSSTTIWLLVAAGTQVHASCLPVTDINSDGITTTGDYNAYIELLGAQQAPDLDGNLQADMFDLLFLTRSLSDTLPDAATARVWITRFSDGDQRDAQLLPYDDGQPFDQNQDDGRQLFTELAPAQVSNEPINTEWRVIIDPSGKLHEVKGVGASMTDAAAYVLDQLRQNNPALFEWTMDRMFDRDTGAGFSYLRKPMGSSDFTATPTFYTYADRSLPDLSGFSIAHDRNYIIPMMQEALCRNPSMEIMASPWSPPAWMKTSGSLIGLSDLDLALQRTNRLKPEHFGTYADYFVRFIEAYAAEGITIGAITLQNEPQFDNASYPCMRMTSGDQIALVEELVPRFADANIETEIVVHDHNWLLNPADQAPPWDEPSVDPLQVVQSIFNDPNIGDAVAGSAWHCYYGNDDDMRSVYSTLRSQYTDKLIYTTELTGWGADRGVWWPDVEWGLRHNWFDGIASGASVALEWNLVLDHQFGPTPRNDSQGVGLATVNTDTWEDVRFEREFYAMAHVSRAAQPGSHVAVSRLTRFGGTYSGNDVQALAFSLTESGYAVVLVNRLSSDQTVAIQTVGGEWISVDVPPRGMATAVRRYP